MLLHPPLPDLAAFDADSSIEKKRRAPHMHVPGSAPSFAFPPPGAAVPAAHAVPLSLAATNAAAAAHAFPPGMGLGGMGGTQVPAFLSSSQGRPVCPSTPMKTPSSSRLFHSHGRSRADSGGSDSNSASVGRQSALSSALSLGLLQASQAVPMSSPTQHVSGQPSAAGHGQHALAMSMSARRKGRPTPQQGTTPTYSRPSSGSGTPRGEKRKLRSSSGELLAALSKRDGGDSNGTSPERRSLHARMAGLTPMSSCHSLDGSEHESVCSSVAHSPMMSDPFLFTPPPAASASASVTASAVASQTHSLVSSLHNSWHQSRTASGFGPGVGIMGSAGAFNLAPASASQQHNAFNSGLHGLSMSTGHRRPQSSSAAGHLSSSYQPTRRTSASGPFSPAAAASASASSSAAASTPSFPALSSPLSMPVASSPAASSHFASSFLNLGVIGRGSFGVCYHVLQVAPAPGEHGVPADGAHMVGREFAVKKSIQPFKGENDRNQKLKEVAHWRLLMNSNSNSSNAHADEQQHQQLQQAPVRALPQPIPSSRDHLHLVRCYDAWEESGFLYMQSELFRSGTARWLLDSLSGAMEEDMLWLLLLDLARGLRCLHNKAKLIHLDLKWDNCFIVTGDGRAQAEDAMDTGDAAPAAAEDERGILKIGDFGLSVRGDATDASALAQQRIVAQEASASMAFPVSGGWTDGSSSSATSAAAPASAPSSSLDAEFIRPEVAEGDQTYLAPEFMDSSLLGASGGRVTAKADIFSLGIMLFEAAFDVSLPRRGQSWIDLRNERIDWSGRSYADSADQQATPASRSPELIHLMQRMLRRNPAARPSIDEVLREPTLVAFARGERGAAQRAALRALPVLLPPASKEVREQALAAAREQQASAAAAAATQAATAAAAQPLVMQSDATRDLEAALLSSSHSLRASRSRSTAAAMRVAASAPPQQGQHPPSPVPAAGTEDSLAPKNLFSAFADAAEDD